jgi:4-hydroxy-4-methyl-2-oxoglutarate aldolase
MTSRLDVDGGALDFGHRPIVGPKIVRNVPRLPEDLMDQFRHAFVPDISDAVGQLYTMESAIRPLYQPMKRAVGIALTVKTPPGDNVMIHRALSMVQAGDVLVIDARGYTESCGTGAGSMTVPISNGLAGVVVDGAWRDIGELQALDFPIYGKGISPFSPPKSRPGEINVPVCCGGVIVHAGDLVICDAEGGVVVPRQYAKVVAEELTQYTQRASLSDWDLDQIAQNAVSRNAYFDELFRARGGVYVDWPDWIG